MNRACVVLLIVAAFESAHAQKLSDLKRPEMNEEFVSQAADAIDLASLIVPFATTDTYFRQYDSAEIAFLRLSRVARSQREKQIASDIGKFIQQKEACRGKESRFAVLNCSDDVKKNRPTLLQEIGVPDYMQKESSNPQAPTSQ